MGKSKKREQSKAEPAKSESSKTRISISSLSRTINEEHLKEIFGLFGKIQEVTLAVDDSLGMSKGYGFVEYESESDAKAAIEHMHGGQMDGSTIKVEYPHDRQKRMAAEKAAAEKPRPKPKPPMNNGAEPPRNTGTVARLVEKPPERNDRSDRDRNREKDHKEDRGKDR